MLLVHHVGLFAAEVLLELRYHVEEDIAFSLLHGRFIDKLCLSLISKLSLVSNRAEESDSA